MRKLFVFDLDDTLIDNVHDYAEPILQACRIIIRELGSRAPHVAKIIAMEQEIDTRRVKEINPATGKAFLFSMERFPGSLVETYRAICLQARLEPKTAVEKELYQAGLLAFDENRYHCQIKPGARAVINFLKTEGDAVALLSKGDARVQEKKVLALVKADICFNRVTIVDDKSTSAFEEISQTFGRNFAKFSVGNSYESDIAPSLAAGFAESFYRWRRGM